MATTRTDSPLPAYAIRLRLCHGGTKCLVLTTCIGVPGCMPARLVVYQRNDSGTNAPCSIAKSNFKSRMILHKLYRNDSFLDLFSLFYNVCFPSVRSVRGMKLVLVHHRTVRGLVVTQRIWYQPCPAFTTSEPGSGKPSSSYLPSP